MAKGPHLGNPRNDGIILRLNLCQAQEGPGRHNHRLATGGGRGPGIVLSRTGCARRSEAFRRWGMGVQRES